MPALALSKDVETYLGTIAGQSLSYFNLTELAWPISHHVVHLRLVLAPAFLPCLAGALASDSHVRPSLQPSYWPSALYLTNQKEMESSVYKTPRQDRIRCNDSNSL